MTIACAGAATGREHAGIRCYANGKPALPPVDLKAIFNVDDTTILDAEDILRPFDELVPIVIEGNEVKLPNNNSLWRGMQFWGLMTGEITIDFGLYCIAGTCKNCKTRIRRPGEDRKLNVLACQTMAEPGIEIVRLAPGFKFRRKQYGETTDALAPEQP